MDLVDERLKIRGQTGVIGSRVPQRRVGLAGSIQNAVENAVP